MSALNLFSCGAGVQSTTIGLMAAEGLLPGLDAAIFADTGWEPPEVYTHLDLIGARLATIGVPLYRVHAKSGNIRSDVLDRHTYATVPAYIRKPNGKLGKVLRQCTSNYKIKPVERQARILLGAPVAYRPCPVCSGTGERVPPWDLDAGVGPCDVCQGSGSQRRVGSVPRGRAAIQWIGFSTDEIGRVTTKGFPRWSTPRFPLVELDMSRSDCERWLADRGVKARKSACIGCPFHDNETWRYVREEHPDEWADAVEFDEQFRKAPGLDGERYLHRSLLPLRLAPIDEDDGGPVSGCSPYACRSSLEEAP